MNRRTSLWVITTLFLSISLFPAWLCGQTANGNIVGRVTDATGAVVTGATVTAANPAKGFTTRTTTDEQGVYRLFYLEPAVYTLTFQSSGFSTLERPDIALRSNDTLSVDVQLAVGNVVEKMEVTGVPPLLEAVTSTTGTVMAGVQMNALPVMQRWTWMAMYMLPGVITEGSAAFHIAGQRARGVGFVMDGISGADPIREGTAVTTTASTTQNAIEEVKMVTTALPAEYGHSAGGLMSVTYKSGTNQLHGEAEDRYINNTLLHRAYFNAVRATSPFSYHNLAALLTGPVYLPKLYNGKDKTFFMFGWSRHHEKYNQQLFADVPTADMFQGDFSFNGLGYPVYDPTSTRQDAKGTWIRDPFPGNRIPPSRFDPVASKFLTYKPWNPPNNMGNAGYIDRAGPHANFGADQFFRSYYSRWDTKIDHVFSEKNRLFGRYSQVRARNQSSYQVGLNWKFLDSGMTVAPFDQENIVISDTHMFSPSLINELRVGVNRRKDSYSPAGMDAGWAQTLGIPGVGPETFPVFRTSGGSAFYGATMPGAPYFNVTENSVLQDNVTFIRLGHTFKAGWEVIRTRGNSKASALPSGTYYFGGTDMPFTPNTGNDFAGFLLGSVVRADFSKVLATWLPRWWMHSGFLQDDWRVTPKLTLNLGVRWSYESPYQTKYGQQSQFDPTATDPITGLRGAIVHSEGFLGRRDLNNFQPRIGGAYTLNNKMVLRGGFGLATIDILRTGLLQSFEEYSTSVTRQAPSGDPRSAFFISQGPGVIPYQVLPDGTSPFIGVNYSSRGATWWDPGLRSPYAMNWNFTYQYQFLPTWLVELSYQGSAGVKLLNSWNINVLRPDISSDRAVLDQIYLNVQPYRPYPQFGGVNLWSNFGHSTFHSGNVKVEKRLSSGLNMTSHYTWGKAIDEAADNDGGASGITFFNRALEKGRAGFDLTHRWVTYLTYELPVGKGRKWMSKGGAMDYLLGGWNVSWVQTFQSGPPVTFTMAGSPNRYLPTVSSRPIQLVPNDEVIVKDWQIGDRFNNNLKNPMWNIGGFAYPAAYTFNGAVGRNTVDGPALVWSQGSLAKNIKVRERYNLDVRFDIQNVFKNPNFSKPSSSVNLINPGTFGKPTGTVGGWCCLGGSFAGTLVVRVWF
ncbi:MAG: TonB-dependent receptor [Bryobacterales bacterium]|nr:TonB-dependent receptor [Bryobacterales bacterium]